MSIPGYELKRQVVDHLAALEHEKRGCMSARHMEEIEAQQARFRAELERMEAAGEGGEYETTDRALGTIAWVGTHAGRVPR